MGIFRLGYVRLGLVSEKALAEGGCSSQEPVSPMSPSSPFTERRSGSRLSALSAIESRRNCCARWVGEQDGGETRTRVVLATTGTVRKVKQESRLRKTGKMAPSAGEIEREVILNISDKNSKIPILHEYKKRPKSALTAIAPDGPAKQIAWTEDNKSQVNVHGEDTVILTRIQHGHIETRTNMGMEELAHQVYKAHPMQVLDGVRGGKPQPHAAAEYRSTYRSANTADSYMYNGHHSGVSTGAVPRTWTSTSAQPYQPSPTITSRPPALLPHQQGQTPGRREQSSERKADDKTEAEEERITLDTTITQGKDSEKNKAFPSRTLHTIKDMISSRFGGAKGPKDNVGGLCVSEGDKTDSGAALNNTDKATTPRKQLVRDEDQEFNQRQHMLGGGPQVIGPSRNYGDSHGMCTEDTTRKSGRGKGGPLDKGIYATARTAQQEQHSRSVGDFTRELPHQGPEPTYNYQRHGGKVLRQGQNFGSQPGMLDQNGIYMVMRQSSQQQQSHSSGGPGSSHHQGSVYSSKDSHYPQQESSSRTEEQNVVNVNNERRHQVGENDPRRQDRENSGAGSSHSTNNIRTMNEPTYNGNRECQVFGASSRRGSQCRLDDEDDDEGGFITGVPGNPSKSLRGSNHSGRGDNPPPGSGYTQQQSSGQSSDYEKATQRSTGQSSSNADSGRGSTVYSSGHQMVGQREERLDTSTESSESPGRRDAMYGLPQESSEEELDEPLTVSTDEEDSEDDCECPYLTVTGHIQQMVEGEGANELSALNVVFGNDSEWVDIVESELRQILDPKMHGLGHPPPIPAGANSTLSESISSLTPPLPPLSPGGESSPTMSPRNSIRYKLGASLPYGGKLDYSEGVKLGDPRKPLVSGAISKTHRNAGISSMNTPSSKGGWSSRVSSKNQLLPDKQHRSSKKSDQLLERSKGGKIPLSASVFGLDTADLTSTTTGLDSMLDNNTENNSSDDDLSTTIDATDAHAIRKQLEGLESMYSEVLKLLGVKKYGGRYQPSDPRINKRRLYGSMSSLPSSGINKRFQRLESHVVTLARSVAHLSSEMRTQHLMIQEMENIRGEISALRGQTLAARSQSVPRGLNALQGQGDAALTNPTRVKKLTKFFGDEPPLLRLFLKKLGYEKYAGLFETERVGMVELPYMTEEMLQKMGIPLGPRLRILQEAQISVQCRDKVYVVEQFKTDDPVPIIDPCNHRAVLPSTLTSFHQQELAPASWHVTSNILMAIIMMIVCDNEGNERCEERIEDLYIQQAVMRSYLP
uniref:(California timema) hypothetical protein n=1 Tax=Timema californicum TaxID=61474 RepID=A0A7R9P6S9_TIMCA|nr:unnamed protein product [Timema californicum]